MDENTLCHSRARAGRFTFARARAGGTGLLGAGRRLTKYKQEQNMKNHNNLLLLNGLLWVAAPQATGYAQQAQAPAGQAINQMAGDFRITRIRFFPREGHAGEMKGGQFVGSLTSATNDFQGIVEIKDAPAEGQWTELEVPGDRAKAFRFVKYQSRNDIWGDIAEVEFYAGAHKLSGTPFGTSGSTEVTNNPQLAFDNNTSTFFRGTSGFQQYVGIDLGPNSQVAAPAFSVAPGTYPAAQSISLSNATPGARIIYSVDAWGRPTLDDKGQPQNGAFYDGQPIALAKSGILQAVAVKPGLADSTTALAAYRIGGMADLTERAEFHIGNSLTDTVNPWMEPLATSGGHKIRFYRFTIPGAPTDWLWDHPGSGFGESNYEQAFLARAPLTDIITQPFAGHNRSVDNEADYSGRFYDAAHKYSPKVQPWLYVQWPSIDFSRDNWAQGKSSFNGKDEKIGEPAKTYQEAIQNHARYTERVRDEMNRARSEEIKAGRAKSVRIIPGGLALAELKTRIEAGQVPGMTDFVAEVFHSPTDFHMSSKGAYLISLVHYACLYGESPEGKVTAANSGLTPEQAKLFQQIAWQVASNYPYSGLKAMNEPAAGQPKANTTGATGAVGAAQALGATNAAAFPRPKYLGDPARLGQNIQRTMTLLATSTPQHRNTVKVLFYGQSITEGSWWKAVADDLRRRFPNANLIIENRALGGFSSQLLVRTAESDLYSFYPDLMIFHVYGAHDDYERIIERTRERTTAEVLIQTDHANKDENLSEETDPAKIRMEGAMWDSFMNYVQLPSVARKYNTGIEDQRDIWKQYLRDNNLHAPQLLQDGVHPNAWGNYLMAELAKAYLVRRPEVKLDPMNTDTVRTLVVGKDVRVAGGRLSVPFEGNRVDVIVKPGSKAGGAPATVRIDGSRPSEMGEAYTFTRALSTPGGKWPVILKLGWQKPPLVEDWTMQVKKDPADDKRFTFSLSGSKTGPDGEGSSDQPFVSRSGRITIDPRDWNVEYSLALPGIKPVPDTFTVKWSAVLQGVDEFATPTATDPAIETTVTLAQGFSNGRHTLEISGPASTSIQAIRVYKPLFKPNPQATPQAAAQFAGASVAASQKVAPIRILPLGDSITQGGRADRAEYTYRYPLFYRLKDAGYNVDFIGSMHGGLNGEAKWPDINGVAFDLDHEGHYGWKTAQARDKLREWMATYPAPPDIALIHLGTNDQSSKDFQSDIITPLRDMVAMLREKNPRVTVLIGHLNFNGGSALQIRPLVEQLAREMSTTASPVATVNHFEGWHEKPDEDGSDTFDWAHPNPQGQRKMAQKWFDAMKPHLDRLKAERAR